MMDGVQQTSLVPPTSWNGQHDTVLHPLLHIGPATKNIGRQSPAGTVSCANARSVGLKPVSAPNIAEAPTASSPTNTPKRRLVNPDGPSGTSSSGSGSNASNS